MSEHPDVTDARFILAEARAALDEAKRDGNAAEIRTFTGAVEAAQRQLDRIIEQTSR